jgi:hypothetical protein
MKTYCIVQNLAADSGHKVFVVKGLTPKEAVDKFRIRTSNPYILALQIEEVATDCQLVFDYHNPNYEG